MDKFEMSTEQLAAIIAQATSAAVKETVQELRKPDPKIAAKEAEQEEREKQNRAKMIEMELSNHQAKLAMQAQCSHKKQNGNYSTGGQILNDGMLLVLCSQCSSEWKVPVSEANRRAIESGDLSIAEIAPPEKWLRPQA